MAGMKIALGIVAAFLIQQSNGCEQSKPAPAAIPKPPIHRFENVSGFNGDGVALDTVTGQWCRTWEWHYKAESLNGGLDTLPTCISIFRNVTGGPDDPLGILDKPK